MFGFKRKGARDCKNSVEAGMDMCSNSKNSASNCGKTKNCSNTAKRKK